MAYTDKTRRLAQKVRAEIDTIADQQVRDLVRAWADAWNEVSPDLNATLLDMMTAGEHVTRSQLLRSQRLRKVLDSIAAQLDVLTAEGQARIIGDLHRAIDIAGGAQASIIDSQLPPGAPQLVDLDAWSQIDERGLEAIVRRSTQRIASDLKPLSPAAQRAVRLELIRGFAAGTNPRETARRIVDRTEGRFNGGLHRALTLARTETLDASRAGARAGRMQNADLLSGWEWHCSLGPRTCAACIARDGTIYSLDDPGPEDHPNGRCTALPVTKSWADLGIDIPEPPSIRVSGRDWFADQPPEIQQNILGPSRFNAWKAGDYPPDAWGKTVQNPAWRPALQTTKVPAGYSGGRRPASSLAS